MLLRKLLHKLLPVGTLEFLAGSFDLSIHFVNIWLSNVKKERIRNEYEINYFSCSKNYRQRYLQPFQWYIVNGIFGLIFHRINLHAADFVSKNSDICRTPKIEFCIKRLRTLTSCKQIKQRD
jgi:hypothetical protein